MAFDVRQWLYDQKFEYIPSFTPRERQLFTAGARILEGVIRVGARLVLPGVAAVSVAEMSMATSAAAAPRYGITRIGGRMLGTAFGALMLTQAMLPTLDRFRSDPEVM